jgi:hypothetical protein
VCLAIMAGSARAEEGPRFGEEEVTVRCCLACHSPAGAVNLAQATRMTPERLARYLVTSHSRRPGCELTADQMEDLMQEMTRMAE